MLTDVASHPHFLDYLDLLRNTGRLQACVLSIPISADSLDQDQLDLPAILHHGNRHRKDLCSFPDPTHTWHHGHLETTISLHDHMHCGRIGCRPKHPYTHSV